MEESKQIIEEYHHIVQHGRKLLSGPGRWMQHSMARFAGPKAVDYRLEHNRDGSGYHWVAKAYRHSEGLVASEEWDVSNPTCVCAQGALVDGLAHLTPDTVAQQVSLPDFAHVFAPVEMVLWKDVLGFPSERKLWPTDLHEWNDNPERVQDDVVDLFYLTIAAFEKGRFSMVRTKIHDREDVRVRLKGSAVKGYHYCLALDGVSHMDMRKVGYVTVVLQEDEDG